MKVDDEYLVRDRQALREIVPEAGPRPAGKVIDHVDEVCERFIAASPFLVLGTYGPDGLVDLSPKGDPAGFVSVIDRKTLALPDRLGNGRLDSFENLMENPAVSLIFVIPGHNDTLRIGGSGKLTTQPDILDRLAHNGRPPAMALLVRVEEAYLHCAKSMVRSRLWHPGSWPDTGDVPSLAEAMVAHGQLIEKGLVADTREMQTIIDDDRENRLY